MALQTMKKVIVFGSFDPLHAGHVDFFRQAKEFGGHLTAVVARDTNIRKLKRHEERFPESKRLSDVQDVEYVDEAILGDERDFSKVLEDQKPDLVVLGYDQKVPREIADRLKKFKVVRATAYKPELYKSSKIYPNN